jgi:hypothetical protein
MILLLENAIDTVKHVRECVRMLLLSSLERMILLLLSLERMLSVIENVLVVVIRERVFLLLSLENV